MNAPTSLYVGPGVDDASKLARLVVGGDHLRQRGGLAAGRNTQLVQMEIADVGASRAVLRQGGIGECLQSDRGDVLQVGACEEGVDVPVRVRAAGQDRAVGLGRQRRAS